MDGGGNIGFFLHSQHAGYRHCSHRTLLWPRLRSNSVFKLMGAYCVSFFFLEHFAHLWRASIKGFSFSTAWQRMHFAFEASPSTVHRATSLSGNALLGHSRLHWPVHVKIVRFSRLTPWPAHLLHLTPCCLFFHASILSGLKWLTANTFSQESHMMDRTRSAGLPR